MVNYSDGRVSGASHCRVIRQDCSKVAARDRALIRDLRETLHVVDSRAERDGDGLRGRQCEACRRTDGDGFTALHPSILITLDTRALLRLLLSVLRFIALRFIALGLAAAVILSDVPFFLRAGSSSSPRLVVDGRVIGELL